MTAEANAAYWAGLFDGEGCVQLRPNSGNVRGVALWVSVCMTHKPVIDELCAQYGGSVLKKKKAVLTRKQQWDWRTWCGSAERFLHDIRPYTKIKSPEIDVAFATVELMRNVRQQGSKGKPEEFWVQIAEYAKQISHLKRVEFCG